ncbi:4-alpha-glucanotransferase, partial [Niveispirillum sp.]|uniref:4-alpha-glucanotransferase n=1 Tax=Niveispirillum sp. TaxID=1917217 RepID=UPI001B7A21E7
ERLRDHFGFPGMRVLPFEWGDHFEPWHYDPNRYAAHSVFYTGTHDNDTILGWVASRGGLDGELGHCIRSYLNTDGRELHWDFIRFALGVNSELVITPVQDVLGLGTEGRMNVPGLPDGNWGWRLKDGQWREEHSDRLRDLTAAAGRLG